jgi:EF hand
MMMTNRLAAIVLGAALSSGAWAQTEQKGPASRDLEKEFSVLDRNSDGYLSRDEISGNKAFTSGFQTADKNADGKLDPSEFQALTAEGSPDRSLGSVSPRDAGAGKTAPAEKR